MIEWSCELTEADDGFYILPLLALSWEHGFAIHLGIFFWLFTVRRQEIIV